MLENPYSILMQKDRGEEQDNSEDSCIELEEETEASAAAAAKLKKLKAKLAACEAERQENLDGWQRARADLANLRRTLDTERRSAARHATKEMLLRIIPVLDHFDAACKDAQWQSVNTTWRSGVEQIFKELQQALAASGCQMFGAVGDSFDPTRHEAVSIQFAEHEESDETITKVLQLGYMFDGTVVRPAKVVVAQHST